MTIQFNQAVPNVGGVNYAANQTVTLNAQTEYRMVGLNLAAWVGSPPFIQEPGIGGGDLKAFKDANGNTVAMSDGSSTIQLSNANTLAVIGDSLTAQGRIEVTASPNYQYTKNNKGFVTQALALSGHRLSVIYDSSQGGSGVTGNATGTSFQTQIIGAIASGAGHLLCLGGENDFITIGATVDQVMAGWQAIIGKAISSGMKVWWCTSPTINAAGGSYTVAIQGKILQANQRIRDMCSSIYANKGVYCVDLAAKTVNPASATADWFSNATFDNQHPRNIGAYVMGKELARVWSSQLPEGRSLLTSVADNYVYSTSSSNLMENGLFTAGASPGTGFTCTGNFGATGTHSLVPRSADGYGNDVVIVITFPAGNSNYEVRRADDWKARVAGGDTVYAECEVTVANGATNLRGVTLALSMSFSLASQTWLGEDGGSDNTNDVAELEGYTKVLRTKPFTYNAALHGTISTAYAYVAAKGMGVGGATVRVGRMSVRKLRNW